VSRPQLVLPRGLPGSGKTTWAREWVSEAPQSRVRVNRDSYRDMWQGTPGLLPYGLEEKITKAQQSEVRMFLRAGISVVVDDMNLRPKYVRAWQDIAEQCGAEFIVQDDFLLVPLEVCIQRDKERAETMSLGRYVGEGVIRGLHERFLMANRLHPVDSAPSPVFPVYQPNILRPEAWICDLDGTLAIKGDRDIYDGSKVYLDTVNQPVAEMLYAMHEYMESTIIYLSGRDEKYRAVTEQWLHAKCLPRGPLFMRPEGDRRDDAVVKNELFEKHVGPHYNVIGVFDDRRRVVEMWRAKGLFCAQVDWGEF
jgi:predicted kinase